MKHNLSKDFKWIDIRDDQPRQFERVLVICYNRQNHMDRHVSIATYFGRRGDTGAHRWSDAKCVSHWMYLPGMIEIVGD